MAANKGLDNAKVVEVWKRSGGNVSEAARLLKISSGTLCYHLDKAGIDPSVRLVQGKTAVAPTEKRSLPKRNVKKTFILTSVQNNTHLHDGLWDNLQCCAKVTGAELFASSYTYNLGAYGVGSVKRGTAKAQHGEPWYDDRVRDILDKSDQIVELAPGLVWCGRSNISPTAALPLQGFETFTGRRSGIFPHAKVAMQSIATTKFDATKFNYTTGTATKLNYIQKKAGLIAEHHHSYGALLVEVDSDGRWFCRQLTAETDGSFQDLDVLYKDGKAHKKQRVSAITFGDIHTANLDPIVRELAWGEGGMVDTLKPEYQFFHDLLDFRARNSHERRNVHRRLQLHYEGRESVMEEIAEAATFLEESSRNFCQTVVVRSNHDEQLVRWLNDVDWREDLVNAEFYLEAQLEMVRSIKSRSGNNIIEWAFRHLGAPEDVRFLKKDESFVLLKNKGGGIECGLHGDQGPNGTRGSIKALSKIGRRMNIGDSHTAGIHDGAFQAGTSSLLDAYYNTGPSSWSQSHILTYPSSKRAILTMYQGKWRA